MDKTVLEVEGHEFTVVDMRGPEGYKLLVGYPAALPDDFTDYDQVTALLNQYIEEPPAWGELPSVVVLKLLGALNRWYQDALKN